MHLFKIKPNIFVVFDKYSILEKRYAADKIGVKPLMALDALAVKALCKEFNETIINGRIDKVHQPEKDEILLHIRTFTDNFRLVISAASSNPRLHFTTAAKKNPLTPPMFCMLLRKHLGSGKITGIRQIGFERIIAFDIESYDELGDLTTKHLIVEIMGRHSNIILTAQDGKIIDCIKHVDLTVSSVRCVLPGLFYTSPPSQEKTALTEVTPQTPLELSPQGAALSKAVLNSVAGISPLTAREIVYSAYGRADIRVGEASSVLPLRTSLEKYAAMAQAGNFSPCMITDNATGKILDFSTIAIHQYEALATVTAFSSVNTLLDQFFSGRDAAERMKQKSADLVKLLNTHLERAGKKAVILSQTLKDAENKETYKLKGDLITANIYKIKDKDRSVLADNYYDPAGGTILIQLDPSLSASQNAQRYYKKYQKAKNAEIEVAQQQKQNQAAIDYLESTLMAVENASSEEDLNAIRSELREQGYLKKLSSQKNRRQTTQSKPMHFISSDGFDIYVGKNNTQNDWLTLKFANSSDLWFHTKNIHGSHTVIKLKLDKEVPQTTLREAAQLAAYYSKARGSSQVPVDYTAIKNVKKPNGAKPGMVIYDHYNTVYVTPHALEEEKQS